MKLGILCGGRSGEHEVSLQSALGIFGAAERPRFEPLLVAIGKDGLWHAGQPDQLLLHPGDPARIRLNPQSPPLLPIAEGGRCLLVNRENLKTAHEVEVFFPIVHGTDGEDGALQGMLRLMDVPFVGADVAGSAIGMDKDLTKRLLGLAGLPVARWETLAGAEAGMGRFAEFLGAWGCAALFVKPAALGSSVGVSRAESEPQFAAALATAFRYGATALVEEAVEGREIECSVLGNRQGAAGPPRASRAGEVVSRHAFYSYEAKYLDPEGAKLSIPAELAPQTEAEIQRLAVRAFEILGCDGLARVDFFLKPDGSLLVNEINTLPGFTNISMYPKLWEASGLAYSDLITRLVELAIERHRARAALERDFHSG